MWPYNLQKDFQSVSKGFLTLCGLKWTGQYYNLWRKAFYDHVTSLSLVDAWKDWTIELLFNAFFQSDYWWITLIISWMDTDVEDVVFPTVCFVDFLFLGGNSPWFFFVFLLANEVSVMDVLLMMCRRCPYEPAFNCSQQSMFLFTVLLSFRFKMRNTIERAILNTSRFSFKAVTRMFQTFYSPINWENLSS